MLIRILAPYLYPPSRANLTEYTSGERYVRDIAYGLKDAQPWAVEVAAADMAFMLLSEPRHGVQAVLVPIPSSGGHSFANLVLASEIVRRVNWSNTREDSASVLDCLSRSPQESSRVRRKRGEPGLSASEQDIRWLCARPEGRVWLIDNVVTTGASAVAAGRAIKRDVGVLTWAKAPNVGLMAAREAWARRGHTSHP